MEMRIHTVAGTGAKERRMRAAAFFAFRESVKRALLRVAACAERARQRRALAQLDERLLSDSGIGRREAAREIAKPFWR